MDSCIFNHWSTRRSDGLHCLVLRFPEQPFLGLFDWRLLLPYIYSRILSRLESVYWVFKFYKVYSNTLDIFLFWLIIHVQSGQYLGGSASFLVVLLFFNISDFSDGFPKWSVNISNFSRVIWLVCPILSLR